MPSLASLQPGMRSPIVPASKLLGSSPLCMHVPLWQPSLMSSPTSASLSTSSPALCESPADSLGGQSPCPWSLRKPNARRAMGATVLSSSMALARGAAREGERERSSPSSLMAIRPLTPAMSKAREKAEEKNDGVAHTALPMLRERGHEKGDEKGRECSDESDVECGYDAGHVRSSPARCSWGGWPMRILGLPKEAVREGLMHAKEGAPAMPSRVG